MRSIAHETKRNSRRIGSTADDSSSPVAEGKEGADRGCPAAGRVTFSSESMAAGPAAQRSQCPEVQAASGRQAAPEPPSTAQVGADSFAWPVSGGLRHGPLDVSSRGDGDSGRVRGDLSSRPRVAAPEAAGLELPEARTTGARAGRGRDPALAPRGMAADKKRARAVKQSLPSWTKAASCCSRSAAAPGRRAARRRSSTRGIGTIGFRPSPQSPTVHVDNGSVCSSRFALTIFAGRTWSVSCARCTDKFVGRSLSYGIA